MAVAAPEGPAGLAPRRARRARAAVHPIAMEAPLLAATARAATVKCACIRAAEGRLARCALRTLLIAWMSLQRAAKDLARHASSRRRAAIPSKTPAAYSAGVRDGLGRSPAPLEVDESPRADRCLRSRDVGLCQGDDELLRTCALSHRAFERAGTYRVSRTAVWWKGLQGGPDLCHSVLRRRTGVSMHARSTLLCGCACSVQRRTARTVLQVRVMQRSIRGHPRGVLPLCVSCGTTVDRVDQRRPKSGGSTARAARPSRTPDILKQRQREKPCKTVQ